MIILKNLSVTYKNNGNMVNAIKDFSLSINRGEICVLLGASGGGKSTILKVLAGIKNDFSGEVLINNMKVDPRIHKIGFIPQNYGLLDWKRVKDNILLSAKTKYGKDNIDYKLYEQIVETLGIKSLEKKYPKSLSGGEKQRVALGRALLLKPDILLMDEPFSALDAITKEDCQELFLHIWKKHKVTTILVTHDIKEALYLGNKIGIISKSPGKLLELMGNPICNEKNILLREYARMYEYIRNIIRRDRNYEVKEI